MPSVCGAENFSHFYFRYTAYSHGCWLLDSLRDIFLGVCGYFSILFAASHHKSKWHLALALRPVLGEQIYTSFELFSVFFLGSLLFLVRDCSTLSCFCRIASVSCSFVHIWHVRCENFFNKTVNSWCRLRNYGSSKKVFLGNVRFCIWVGRKINQRQSSWGQGTNNMDTQGKNSVKTSVLINITERFFNSFIFSIHFSKFSFK